jgi:hypothetical protein
LHLGIFWGGVSRYAAMPLIVALPPGHSDITRFRPWSPITTGNDLDLYSLYYMHATCHIIYYVNIC